MFPFIWRTPVFVFSGLTFLPTLLSCKRFAVDAKLIVIIGHNFTAALTPVKGKLIFLVKLVEIEGFLSLIKCFCLINFL